VSANAGDRPDDEEVGLMDPARPAMPEWPETPAQERELLDRMQHGEESAFDVFAERYVAGLYRFALRRLAGDREIARDLVQATVCKVIEKLDSYRAEAPLFTWLCAVCRNEIAAHFRRIGRRPREVGLEEKHAEVDAASVLAAPPGGAEERFGLLERRERVHLALDRVPPAYARVVEWRYLEDVSVTEIARRLGTSYKATESLLSRARAAFRASYESLSGTDSVASTVPFGRGTRA
jgi:RNA polymerase sigma-70 factor (ECF subfamily)